MAASLVRPLNELGCDAGVCTPFWLSECTVLDGGDAGGVMGLAAVVAAVVVAANEPFVFLKELAFELAPRLASLVALPVLRDISDGAGGSVMSSCLMRWRLGRLSALSNSLVSSGRLRLRFNSLRLACCSVDVDGRSNEVEVEVAKSGTRPPTRTSTSASTGDDVVSATAASGRSNIRLGPGVCEELATLVVGEDGLAGGDGDRGEDGGGVVGVLCLSWVAVDDEDEDGLETPSECDWCEVEVIVGEADDDDDDDEEEVAELIVRQGQ